MQWFASDSQSAYWRSNSKDGVSAEYLPHFHRSAWPHTDPTRVVNYARFIQKIIRISDRRQRRRGFVAHSGTEIVVSQNPGIVCIEQCPMRITGMTPAFTNSRAKAA